MTFPFPIMLGGYEWGSSTWTDFKDKWAADTYLGSYSTGVIMPDWTVEGFKISATVFGIVASGLSSIALGNVEMGACSNFQIYAGANSVIAIGSNYSVSGASTVHWAAYDGGSIICQTRMITITGTPAFGTAFALAGRGGKLAVNGNTFSGSATGVRYNATLNGVIDTAGGGATYLPGGTSGSTATGGQYA